jgi:hypothetical protein
LDARDRRVLHLHVQSESLNIPADRLIKIGFLLDTFRGHVCGEYPLKAADDGVSIEFIPGVCFPMLSGYVGTLVAPSRLLAKCSDLFLRVFTYATMTTSLVVQVASRQCCSRWMLA